MTLKQHLCVINLVNNELLTSIRTLICYLIDSFIKALESGKGLYQLIILITYVLLNGLAHAQDSYSESEKNITIGLTQAPPMIYLNETQPPSGMIVDFLKEIADREGWNIIWRTGSWSQIYSEAEKGKIDLMTYIAYTDQRAKHFLFSNETFITGWGQVYIKESESLQSILDFQDKTVSVVKNDIHSFGYKELCEKFKVNCNIDYVDNYDIAFGKLVNGEVSGVVCGSTVGVTYQNKYDVHRSSVMFNPTNALFAVSNVQNKYIVDTIDRYLVQWKSELDSPYNKLLHKWMDTNLGFQIPLWLKYLVIFIVLLLIASVIIVQVLRQQVKKHIIQHVNQSKQLKQIIDLVPHMIYVVDQDRNFTLLNEYAARFFHIIHYQDDNNTGKKVKIENDSPVFFEDEKLFEQNNNVLHKEIRLSAPDDEDVFFDISKVPFRTNEDIPAVLTVAVDVSEAKKYHEKIKYMAQHDDLTGLPNRELLKSRINDVYERNNASDKQYSVLFIDLDYFKNINDSLGHVAGDELLKIIATRLSKIIKESDLVARIGGDEFILFLDDKSTDVSEANQYAIQIAELALDTLIKKIVINHHDLYISASIGIVTFPHDANNYEQVMQRADIAMYQAKEKGRNCIVLFEQEMQNNIVKRQHLISELRKSLSLSEFYIEFQPQIQFEDEEIIGLEALIRWKNKNESGYSTYEFIRAAEESGLIIPISYWVIEQVFITLEQWSAKYSKLPFITINISVLQLHDSSIVEFLQYLMEKYQVPSNYVELEVTESVLVDKVKETVETLNGLKDIGVRLSIDDFGTGYSSLSYLRKLPFDKLKIDYSFVKHVAVDQDTTVIVRTIIGMAEDLGLEVIAEGVENRDQLSVLRKMGCKYFQGYYFDKPRSQEYIEQKYLSQWKVTE